MKTIKNYRSTWIQKSRIFSPESLLLVLAIFSRLTPHTPNFTALGAVAIFSGYFFKSRREAFAVALTALLISDGVLGFYPGVLWVYGAFVATILVGRALAVSPKFSWTKTTAANLVAALIFFVVSNFGVWMSAGLYPRTVEGLATCYVAALPFFGNTLASQFLFGTALFLTHRALQRRRASTHLQTI